MQCSMLLTLSGYSFFFLTYWNSLEWFWSARSLADWSARSRRIEAHESSNRLGRRSRRLLKRTTSPNKLSVYIWAQLLRPRRTRCYMMLSYLTRRRRIYSYSSSPLLDLDTLVCSRRCCRRLCVDEFKHITNWFNELSNSYFI